MLKITSSELITTVPSIKDAPVTGLPEFLMVGRSNVGKSSFINSLTNRKNLAYISKTPGKTRLINLYKINNQFILTDLPGYGYAKVSASEQQQWKKRIEDYLLNRKEIRQILQLVDSRHEIQKNDLQMYDWLAFHNLPTTVILTKSDLISFNQLQTRKKEALKSFNTQILSYSAKNKTGKPEILSHIELLMK